MSGQPGRAGRRAEDVRRTCVLATILDPEGTEIDARHCSGPRSGTDRDLGFSLTLSDLEPESCSRLLCSTLVCAPVQHEPGAVQRFAQSLPHSRIPPDRMKSRLHYGRDSLRQRVDSGASRAHRAWSADRGHRPDLVIESLMPTKAVVAARVARSEVFVLARMLPGEWLHAKVSSVAHFPGRRGGRTEASMACWLAYPAAESAPDVRVRSFDVRQAEGIALHRTGCMVARRLLPRRVNHAPLVRFVWSLVTRSWIGCRSCGRAVTSGIERLRMRGHLRSISNKCAIRLIYQAIASTLPSASCLDRVQIKDSRSCQQIQTTSSSWGGIASPRRAAHAG